LKQVPQVAILFDKFPVVSHRGAARAPVRQSAEARLTGQNRQLVQGQQYARLSPPRAHLPREGRRALAQRHPANRRLHLAARLKESLGQLGDYQSAAWSRRGCENWQPALKGQRWAPDPKLARRMDRQGDGIAADCQPWNKGPLGVGDGLSNKSRGRHRRACGLRAEEYLRLQIRTCLLPEI
jgi:transposase